MCYNISTCLCQQLLYSLSLYEMFYSKGRSAKEVVLKTIRNDKISKGTLIRDHMIHMIGLFNEIKICGVEIDEET